MIFFFITGISLHIKKSYMIQDLSCPFCEGGQCWLWIRFIYWKEKRKGKKLNNLKAKLTWYQLDILIHFKARRGKTNAIWLQFRRKINGSFKKVITSKKIFQTATVHIFWCNSIKLLKVLMSCRIIKYLIFYSISHGKWYIDFKIS